MIKKETTAVKKTEKTEKAVKAPVSKYFEGIGRRKTAVARVRIQTGHLFATKVAILSHSK